MIFFCDHLLVHFGQFQDAMTCQSEHQWSRISQPLVVALNTKMLHPMQVIKRVIEAFEQQQQKIDIAQVEGFIRQILGLARICAWYLLAKYA